jgi:hypothetical protein
MKVKFEVILDVGEVEALPGETLERTLASDFACNIYDIDSNDVAIEILPDDPEE